MPTAGWGRFQSLGYVYDVLLTTTCLASWKRYHSVLFQTISNVFDVICCQLIWNVCTSTYLYMPLGFFIPEWIQNGIHFESGVSTVSSMLHWDSQTVLFSRGWGIDQPKFSQDKSRVVTVSAPEYDWFVFNSSSLLSCSFCCILELRNSIWILHILLTYTLHLVILHPGCVDVEWCWGPLQWKIQIQNPESINLRGRGTSPYGEPRESQGCFCRGLEGVWLLSVVFKDIWYWGVMLFFCLYLFCFCYWATD